MALIQNPRLWSSSPWSEVAIEPMENALARTPPCGIRFFDRLFAEYPDIKVRLVFLRHRNRYHAEVDFFSEWEDDVIAILDRSPKGIGMQIDPQLSYIIIWSEKGSHGEYGDWGQGNDQVADAMIQVRNILGAAL